MRKIEVVMALIVVAGYAYIEKQIMKINVNWSRISSINPDAVRERASLKLKEKSVMAIEVCNFMNVLGGIGN